MEETISLKEIFEVIKKRFLLIMTFVIGAALLAAIVSFFVLTKQYEAQSQFIVNQAESDSREQYDLNSVRVNVEYINTYNVILRSNVILEEVIEKEGLSYTPDNLKSKIAVSSEEGSQVVNVTVTDTDPAVAVDISNALVATFQEQIVDIMNVDNVKVIARAEYVEDPAPVSPNPKLNIAIAIVLGGMVGVGIAFLLEYLDTTVTTETDIEKLGLPLLGVISHINETDMIDKSNSFQQSRKRRGGFRDA